VVTVNGLSNVANTAFAYFAPPAVTAVLPTSGSTVGATAVTVSGTGFQTGATVTFGGTAATSVVVAANGLSLTAVTPAHAAGLVSIVVTNPAAAAGLSGTLTNAFTYIPPPTVTSVAPATGPLAGGTAVTITGTGFQTTGTTTVSFGGTAATSVVVVSATSITATTPAHAAGAVSVVVTNPDGQVNGANTAFTYGQPTVTSVTPNTGTLAGGTPVTIAGTNFLSGATVTIGGVAATSVVVVSATSITATTPAGAAGAANVVVTTTSGSGTLTGGYTYAPLAVDVTTSTDKAASSTTITSSTFTTTAPNELLLAFIEAGGLPSPGNTVTSVTGGGLTWTMVQRANASLGANEIWRAYAPAVLTAVSVTANLAQSSSASITVVSFKNVNIATPVGASNTGNGQGLPSLAVTTQGANSFVFGCGNDYSGATSHTAGTNQTPVHQYLAATGDTYWVQRQNATTQPAGTVVTINNPSPTGDLWNLCIVEIRGQ
jgi:hypothetical protein